MNEAKQAYAPKMKRRENSEKSDRGTGKEDFSTWLTRSLPKPAAVAEASANICSMRLAQIESSGTGELLVLLDGRLRTVRRAISCLIQPIQGDWVQIVSQGDSAWVTAVLDRNRSERIELNFDSERVSLRAESLELACATSIAITAHRIDSRSTVTTQACTDRYANVSGIDSTKAHTTVVHTEGHMSLHAGNTSLTADTLIKVDAGQVHMC